MQTASYVSSPLIIKFHLLIQFPPTLLSILSWIPFLQRRKTSLRLRKQFLLVGSLLNMSSGSSQLRESPSEWLWWPYHSCASFVNQHYYETWLKQILIQSIKMPMQCWWRWQFVSRFIKGGMNIVDLLGNSSINHFIKYFVLRYSSCNLFP